MLGQLKLFDLGLGVDNETICYAGALLNELLDTITFWQPIFMLLYEASREVAVISSHFNIKTSV